MNLGRESGCIPGSPYSRLVHDVGHMDERLEILIYFLYIHLYIYVSINIIKVCCVKNKLAIESV